MSPASGETASNTGKAEVRPPRPFALRCPNPSTQGSEGCFICAQVSLVTGCAAGFSVLATGFRSTRLRLRLSRNSRFVL